MEEAHDRRDVDRLARVRDNQRKSRARKQQYVKELEQRLSVNETQAQQRDIEYRLAVQKVEAENRHLKTLLASLGVSNASVQQYLQVVEQRENTTQKIAIPAAQRREGLDSPARCGSGPRLPVAIPRVYDNQVKTEPTEQQSSSCGSVCGPAASNGSCGTTASNSVCGPQARNNACGRTSSNSYVPTSSNSAYGSTTSSNACGPSASKSAYGPTASNSACAPKATEKSKSNELSSHEPKVGDPDLCGCSLNGQEMVAATEDDLLNSTLCGIADEMINRYNTKGLDVEEIRRRTWSGFRAGANGTGCRVQNSVLFQVLDEISHDV
ncbi:hypothetical protein N7467_009408 [Penicillium canescens]|nr:hypothetical protein N7467_009408 [Penicillium canescens]